MSKVQVSNNETGSDFRQFLQSEFVRRCRRNSRYSVRSFARALGMESSALSKLLRGKRGISKSMLEKLGQRLGMGPSELARFAPKRMKHAAEATTWSPSQGEYVPLAEDAFEVLSDWYHFAILELSKLSQFSPDPRWIGKMLQINPAEANVAIERLMRVGLVRVRKNGSWELVSWANTVLGSSATPEARRKLQRHVLEMALIALDETPLEQRDQSSMTMAIDSRKLPEARERIQQFRRGLCHFFQKDGELDSVYHLGVSLYPVTRAEAQIEKGKKE